jgi:hypothetical protein
MVQKFTEHPLATLLPFIDEILGDHFSGFRKFFIIVVSNSSVEHTIMKAYENYKYQRRKRRYLTDACKTIGAEVNAGKLDMHSCHFMRMGKKLTT